MSVYRWIERETAGRVSVMQTQGRNTLLETYLELVNQGLSNKCICVADSDLWVFSGAPSKYSGIILTSGYSIENDLVASSSIINTILDGAPAEFFESGRGVLSRWFASYVQKHLKNEPAKVDIPPLALLEVDEGFTFKERFGALEKVGYEEPEAELVADIERNFWTKFRGKTLVAYIFASFQCAKKAKPDTVVYTYEQIIDLTLKSKSRAPGYKSLCARINKAVDAAKPCPVQGK